MNLNYIARTKVRFYLLIRSTRMRRSVILLVLSLCASLLTACAPVISNPQPALTEWLSLGHGVTLGQTFVANYDGLSGIQLSLAPQTPGTGKVTIHLRANAQSEEDIAVSRLPISKVNAAGRYQFHFDPLRSSQREYYYIYIDIRGGDGAVQVGAANGDTYLDGASYKNSIAQDSQLSFQLLYSIRRLGLGLVREFAIWGVILLVGAALFILPGWSLLKLLWPGWNLRLEVSALSWMEKLGLSAGVSLAIYPIVMLWTWLVGLRLGPLYAWLPPIAGIGIIIWYSRKMSSRRTSIEGTPSRSVAATMQAIRLRGRWEFPSLPTMVLTLVLLVLVFTRFWAVRTLDAPMWGDSYQHTVIAQLIVDHNGLFRSWQPYADLKTFTYHFGFHSTAAVFHWITGLAMPRAVLWLGQLMNILAVLSVYPLAMKVCRNRWSGVTAVIISGLLTSVPMTYTNWGRYTQLAGQIVLMSAIYMLWSVLFYTSGSTHPAFHSRRVIFLTAFLMGGLALTHFRVLIFAILFLAALFIINMLERVNKQEWKSLLRKTFWIGLGGGIIFLPWFMNVFGGKILRNFTNQLTTPASAVPLDMQNYNTIGNLAQYMPVGIWLLLPLVIAWGLWKQHKGMALFSIYCFLMLVAANPAWLGLPGTGSVNNFAIFIAVYIPAGILLGGAVGLLADEFFSGEWRADVTLKLLTGWKATLLRMGVVGVRKNPHMVRWADIMIALILAAISLYGTRQRLTDLHPNQYALLTRPDMRAASWINCAKGTHANILVNSFLAYGGSLLVGSDGGWWLPILTQCDTSLPPLNYGTEQSFDPNYKKWVNELFTSIYKKGITHPDVLQMLTDRGITHIYIGQQHGRVNYGGPVVLDSRQLTSDPHFRVVYHQDRVWIFKVVQLP